MLQLLHVCKTVIHQDMKQACTYMGLIVDFVWSHTMTSYELFTTNRNLERIFLPAFFAVGFVTAVAFCWWRAWA